MIRKEDDNYVTVFTSCFRTLFCRRYWCNSCCYYYCCHGGQHCGTLSLAAAVGAGYALGSAAGGESRTRREQGAGVSREAVRRELEAAYAKGYEEAQRVVMDELKALEYERGRKVAQRQ